MARPSCFSVMAILLLVGSFACSTIRCEVSEVLVTDDTNVKHHLPTGRSESEGTASLGEDVEGEEVGREFIAGPGHLLPQLSEEEEIAALGRLVQWLKEESSSFAGISLDRENGKSFLKAEADYEGGSLLATLPLCAMISTSTPSEGMPSDTPFCDLSRRWEQALLVNCFKAPGGTASDEEKKKHYIDPSRGSKVLLALALIHELKKDGGSFYQPFLNVLPRQLSQPVCWSNAAIAELQVSPIASAIEHAREQLHADYRILAKHLFTHPAQGFTEGQFNWAMLYVSARMEEIYVPSRARPIKALVPLMDFLQIDPIMGSIFQVGDGPGLDEMDLSLYGFDYSAGDPLLIRKPSCFTSQCLLLNYGVLPPENQYDHLPLVVIFNGAASYQNIITDYLDAGSATPELFARKARLLESCGLRDVALGPGTLLTVVTAFRTLAMTAEEVKAAEAVVPEERTLLVYAAETISDLNDARATTIISEIIYHSYVAYGTTIEEDEAKLDQLAEADAPLDIVQAVTIRLREKKLLMNALTDLDADGFQLYAGAKVLLREHQANHRSEDEQVTGTDEQELSTKADE